MSPPGALHPQLARQVGNCGGEQLDVGRLLDMVSAAYAEHDRIAACSEHASNVVGRELAEAVARLEVQHLRFRAALDNMAQGVCLFDAIGKVAVCNRQFLEIHGFTPGASLDGLNLEELLDQSPALRQADEMERRLLRAEHLHRAHDRPVELAWSGGRTITLQRTGIEDGGFLLTVSDITQGRQAAERIAWLARHDALTDLPNRTQLRERMQEICRNALRDEVIAVVCVNLDRFKAVNDTYGHPAGDALLVMVAKRLKALIRPQDAIARLGGDEFAVILRHVADPADVERFARRIATSISRPFSVAGQRISIGASLGISVGQVSEFDAVEALRRADIALYAAKAEGRAAIRFYTRKLHDSACTRLQLEEDLRTAIERGEFIVHYQPQLDLRTRQHSAVEALVRWQSPKRGLVLPGDFISVCEEIGVIEELGRFVLETACRDAAAWPGETVIAVNLSPVQFQSGGLVRIITRALARSGLPASRLELEVTENLMLEDTASVLEQINALKKLGCRISLDDFGTGYSSLSYIRQFPFDKIKIDKSFVRDLESNKDSLAIIHAVSGLCESLALESTAEGVETAAQLEILHRKNIASVQGFHVGHPMAASEVGALLAGGSGIGDPDASTGPRQLRSA